MIDFKDKVIFASDYHNFIEPFFYNVFDVDENEIWLEVLESGVIIKIPIHRVVITYHANFSIMRDKQNRTRFKDICFCPAPGFTDMQWLRAQVERIAEGRW